MVFVLVKVDRRRAEFDAVPGRAQRRSWSSPSRWSWACCPVSPRSRCLSGSGADRYLSLPNGLILTLRSSFRLPTSEAHRLVSLLRPTNQGRRD